MTFTWYQRCAVFAACVMLASLALFASGTLHASGRPPGGRTADPVVREVDIAQPAIVRIVLMYTERITFSLCGQPVALPDAFPLAFSGTGTFIDSQGDILTADHVVTPIGDAIFIDPRADSSIAQLLDTYPACHLRQPISASDVANGFVQQDGIRYTTQILNVQRLVWQGTTFTGPIASTSHQSPLNALLDAQHYSATVVAESAMSANDLAIIHVDLVDTPSVPLGDSSSVAPDDQLTVIGYPGNGDDFRIVSDQTFDANDLLTPSINNVTVSAIKTGSNGARLIQVGGNVEHGDSGGPALDASGSLVGIVSFGTLGQGSTSFLRSSNDVLSLIAAASLNTAPGQFESKWRQAFDDYSATYAGHWHVAARELDALSTSHPQFGAVQSYRQFADAAAATEQMPSSSPIASLPLEIRIVAAAGLLVAGCVLILVVLLVGRRRRARRAARAETTQPVTAVQVMPATQPVWNGGHGAPEASGAATAYPSLEPVAETIPGQYPAVPRSYGSVPVVADHATQTVAPFNGYGQPPAPTASVPAPLVSGPVMSPGYTPGYAPPARNGNWPASLAPNGPAADPRDSMPMAQRSEAQTSRSRCLLGHPMLPDTQHCAICGAPREHA